MTDDTREPATSDGREPCPPPAPGGVGLLLVDVINPLDFEDADELTARVLAAAPVIRALRDAADAAQAPVIYVNDNYGHWTSERSRIVAAVGAASAAAGKLVGCLAPRPNDYFVIKPQVSGFYATNLPALLPRLGVSRLVLCGFATDICILFTAADAHMREYDVWVPRDAVAGGHDERVAWALEIMTNSLGAETAPTGELTLRAWIDRG